MSIDHYILLGINSLAGISPFFDGLILFFAKYHIYVMTAAILVIVGAVFFRGFSEERRRAWEMAAFSVASALTARFGFTELIRLFYDRPRPFDLPAEVLTKAGIDHINQLIPHASGGSFPSGHAAFAFAIAAAVSFYYPRLGIFFWPSAILIGLGRIAAGVHWPSDILGGALVGIGTVWFLRLFIEKLKRRI